ncbi:MAG: UvrD-helicase domain-containing protein [Solirubrobacterales bacterium]
MSVAVLTEQSFTAEQEEAAARRRGPLLLAAGAGSGKTSVLVERFVRAVREDGIAPARILAITFTERAAAELRSRVRTRLLELGERGAARDTEGAQIGTFHGFCARLLRVHALSAGLDPGFAILDEAGAARLRQLAFRHALAALLVGARREEAVDLLAAYGADRVRRMVLGVYAEQRSRGASLPSLPRPESLEPAEEEAIRACELLGAALEEFGGAYAQLKRTRSALDFDDLELRALDLLASSEGVRRAWAERIELLMVDEFQDTNRRQLALLELLERGNLFTVGDELQAIYGFRHAEVEIFRERRHGLEAEGAAIALARNFRGRPPLIAAVNSVFGERFGDAYTPLIPAREEGHPDGPLAETGMLAGGECLPASVELLLTDRGGWAESPHARAVAGALPSAPLWRQAEARLLAQRVAELVAAGQTAAGDVAVLLRAAGDLPVYERALEERGLRTLAAVGSFWGHQQVGDLLAWLRALANPLDELALYSVLASPLVGISSDGLALVALGARAAGTGAWAAIAGAHGVGTEGAGIEGEAAESADIEGAGSDGELFAHLPAPDRERLARFAERFAAERQAVPAHGAAELLLRAIAQSGYERHVRSLTWGERRLANVHKLLRLARRFEAAEGRDLRAFLDHVEHRGALAEGAEPHAPTGSEPDAVRLMTIHAAKGLEFPVVCLADLGRTANGAPPDLLVDGPRIGLRLLRLDGAPPVACLRYEELSEERRRAEAAEEERIVYVAMTRARERLLLSGAIEFERWPAERPGGGGAPIVWLAPALAPELPALAHTLERPVVELAVGGEGGAGILCWLNSPSTVGEVLREESLDPLTATPAALGGPGEGAASGAGPAEPDAGETDGSIGADPVPSGPRVGGIETVPLSYTALSELERCGYRYYLERVLGMPENRADGRRDGHHGEGLRARARGSLVHSLLESFDFANPNLPNPQEVGAVARELGIATSPRERAEIAALLRSAAGTALAKRIAAAAQMRREHPFTLAMPGEQLVTGVLDLLAHDPDGGLLVVDYKSDRVAPEEDLERLVEREYGAQRLLYGLAALHAGAQRVEVVHWFLERPGEWVGARFCAEERALLEEALRARVERANARGFAVSEAPHRGLCLSCPGRARLCSWNEADTLRERPALESGDR